MSTEVSWRLVHFWLTELSWYEKSYFSYFSYAVTEVGIRHRWYFIISSFPSYVWPICPHNPVPVRTYLHLLLFVLLSIIGIATDIPQHETASTNRVRYSSSYTVWVINARALNICGTPRTYVTGGDTCETLNQSSEKAGFDRVVLRKAISSCSLREGYERTRNKIPRANATAAGACGFHGAPDRWRIHVDAHVLEVKRPGTSHFPRNARLT